MLLYYKLKPIINSVKLNIKVYFFKFRFCVYSRREGLPARAPANDISYTNSSSSSVIVVVVVVVLL